ncbi:MAG TPA: methyltransferase [Alphaproteobacteria bacterium]|mgnify:CR=1 FL=1|nr:methyltransferase [Alphaproteobacteria bacterium]
MLTFIYAVLTCVMLAVVAFNEYYQRKMKVSPMPTPQSTRKAMLNCIHQKSPKVIAELGSGWGGIALAAAARYPQAKIIGFEGSLIPLLFSKMRLLLHPEIKNVTFENKNFFESDMQDIDVVLCYLSNPHMSQLEPKLDHELKCGAEIVSSTFYMPHWRAREKTTVGGLYDTDIYIYEKTEAPLPQSLAPPAAAAAAAAA